MNIKKEDVTPSPKLHLLGVMVLLGNMLLFSGCNLTGPSTAPWPKFRANDQNNGVATCCDYDTQSRKTATTDWSFFTPDPILSSPAIGADGTIYFGCVDGNVYAVNPTTGKEKWHFQTQPQSEHGISADGQIFVGSVISSPVISSDGIVYIGSDVGLFALNAKDGQLIWSQPIGRIVSSPAIGQYLWVGAGDKVYVFNPTDGASLGVLQMQGNVLSSPAIGLNSMVYVRGEFFVDAFDEPSRRLQWITRLSKAPRRASVCPFTASPAIGADGTVYIGNDEDDSLYALNGKTGDILWSLNLKASLSPQPFNQPTVFSSAAVIFSGGQDSIFVGDNNYLYRIDAKTHQIVWSQPCLSPYASSPAVMRNGALYVGNNKGLIVARSDNVQLISFAPLGDTTTTSPAVSRDGIIYIGAWRRLVAIEVH